VAVAVSRCTRSLFLQKEVLTGDSSFRLAAGSLSIMILTAQRKPDDEGSVTPGTSILISNLVSMAARS
jgi:hypothetical protein